MPDETNTTNDGSAFGQAGGQLPADPTAGMTPEQKAAYDAETEALDKKHGVSQPGYGRVLENASKSWAPPVGSTIDKGPGQ